jgi:phage terminase large subunit
MPDFRLIQGSIQEAFLASKAKIQIFAGGYAGGKTACMCIKALQLAQDYPGSNGLIARETYPKLNDTIRKEFLKWCPPHWIAREPTKDDNTIILTNGTTINFRYVKQQSKQEGGTSNLLSATYDWIFVDQLEDPGILKKDFDDLLGRLRGSTRYEGDDLTMPHTGPRFFVASCNPSRNWVFRELVKPYHTWKVTGQKTDKLLVGPDGEPIIELFEGSTYDNKENLPEDYITTLESTYRGQMRDRFLRGKWEAYEGLVYPDYDESVHKLPHDVIVRYFNRLRMMGYKPTIREAYDHGIAKAGCYGLFFADHKNNLFLLDGHHEKEYAIGDWANTIEDIREKYGINPTDPIKADPACFKRSSADKKVVGKTVSDIFNDCGIWMVPADNGIVSGIAKVQSYIALIPVHKHPIYGTPNAPHLYVSDQCEWWDAEITDYFWKKDTSGENEDAPQDKNDHAMDMTKYAVTDQPDIAKYQSRSKEPPAYMSWQEYEEQESEIPSRRRVN